MKKKVCILGSTGSIGTRALQVIENLKDNAEVVSLSCKANVEVLEDQVRRFGVKRVAVFDTAKARQLQQRLPRTEVLAGMEGLQEIASDPEVNFVLSALSGSVGILPTAAAIDCGKQIGLANKEVLVAAGEWIIQRAQEKSALIIPIDSEHSALFQCLKNESKHAISRLILTASGGPFLHYDKERLSHVSLDEALSHPNYRMGSKNTIDSSTLMNKGLEMIEAHFLFGIPFERIEVVVHPEQFIHSMVEFIDGSILAQASEPNMYYPIQYALTYPERAKTIQPPFDFTKAFSFQFSPPDLQKFPCLELAYFSIKRGGSMPCFMNAVNESLVNRFLAREIRWSDIPDKLEKLMSSHKPLPKPSLELLLEIDAHARKEALCC